ncbi:MAG: EFR1 family ferrodoxin [Promethearchaeota archaeon]
MKIALIYFSCTNNTAEIATVLKTQFKQLNAEVDEYDITNYIQRQNKNLIDVTSYDSFIFGFPVHAWRAPRLIRDWLITLDGKGKKSSVFFTYGGISLGVAHYNVKQILDNQNFKLVSTAEFLGKHTYNLGGWKSMQNRPNQSDFDVARKYALLTYKRFIGKDTAMVQFEKPKFSEETIEKIEQSPMAISPPSREGQECSLCRECENLCPTKAMNSETGKANRNKCIRCFRCFINCPDNALKIKDLSHLFQLVLKKNKLTEDGLKNKKSKIHV